MGFTSWIIKRGAKGLASSLLLLYTDAVSQGIKGEKERWLSAYYNSFSLPVPLGDADNNAMKRICDYLEESDQWSISPKVVVWLIISQKASTAVGGFLDRDNEAILRQGVNEVIDSFAKTHPNRAKFLEDH